MLRIGFDATAVPPNRAGAGNYIFNLVHALAKVDTENEYIVFAKPEHIAEFAINQPNFCFLTSGSAQQRPIRLLWEQLVLPRLVQRYQLEVLHSPHYTTPVLNASCSVVTFCDMTFFLYPEMHSLTKRLFFQQMMRLSSNRADGVITISESTREDLLRLLRVTSDKVYAIPLAAGSYFRPVQDQVKIEMICNKYGLQAGAFILFVGVLEPRKNVPTLLRAYKDLIDKGFREQLAIVGKQGWMFEDIFSRVQTLRLEDRVVFTGYVPDEDLPHLYNGARLFAYPSLYEGFGLPVLEAMACGTPVVTSNVSSMPEIVGDAGLLVDPRDPEQLAQAIERLIVDHDLSQSLRERGLRRAAQFSWEKTARETLKVYTQVCRRKRSKLPGNKSTQFATQ